MMKPALILVPFILTCLLIQIQAGASNKRTKLHRGNNNKARGANRKLIIRCCGRESCHKVVNKKKPTTNSTTAFPNNPGIKTSRNNKIGKSTTSTKAVTASEETLPPSNDENADASSATPKSEATQQSRIIQDETTSTAEVETSTSANSDATTLAEVMSQTSTIQNETPTSLNEPLTTTGTSSPTVSSTTGSSTTSSSTTTTTEITTKTSTTTTSTSTTTSWKKPTTAATKVPQIFPTCPPLCQKDKSLFKTDGTIDDPEFHGFWESFCNELFVFGKVIVNWEQNVEKCCSLGMTPISLETPSKAACFNQFINGNSWKYNSRYWTSGLRSSASQFKWCSNNATIDPPLWVYPQPDNVNKSENCAQMVISKTLSTAKLEDRHCGVISAFACQGPPTPKPKCDTPTCLNITCEKNKLLFTVMRDGVTKYLTNPSMHGKMVLADNRSFLFSYENDTRTYKDSFVACCALGMKLASLHQDFSYNVVPKALKNAKLPSSVFWTSGTDLGCEGYYGYCSTKRLLRSEAKWETGQPDNANGNENCLAVSVSADSALLRDENCDAKYKYICEGRSTSGASSVEKECGLAYNLNSTEIKNLLANMATTVPEKCFLKCYGEGTDLFINGKLMEEKIIAQFAAVSAGDLDKLMEMYSTLSFCANSTRGMDACDKVTQLMKCGRENSPDLLIGLMNNLENAITEAPVALPPIEGVCPTDFQCIINEDYKLLIDKAPNQTAFSSPYFSTAYVTRACSKTIVAFQLAFVTYIGAIEFCCKFGLRLLTLESKEKLTCLAQNSISAPWGAGQIFTIGASRMGNLLNPKWCFSDTPFNFSIAQDLMSGDLNQDNFVVTINFLQAPATPAFYAWGNGLYHFICESLN